MMDQRRISDNTGPPGAYGFRWGDYVIARTAAGQQTSAWLKVVKVRELTAWHEDIHAFCFFDYWITAADQAGRRYQFTGRKVLRHSYQRTEAFRQSFIKPQRKATA